MKQQKNMFERYIDAMEKSKLNEAIPTILGLLEGVSKNKKK